MNKVALVLENNEGKVSRYLHWQSERICVVLRNDTGRVEFVENTDSLNEQNISFECLHDLKISQLIVQNKKQPLQIGANSHLKVVEDDGGAFAIRDDVELSPEDKKTIQLYFKYSAITHVAGVVILLAFSWIVNRYFSNPPEPVIVQVFEQKREDFTKSQATVKTVNVSKNKIDLNKKSYQKQKNLNFAKLKNTSKSVHRRPGLQISNRGALGALGGMGRQYRGSGGLNLSAIRDNPGIGYGGPAARGGFERGLIGKGLIATGIGSGGKLQGYGGNADRGLGGGRPGYSTTNGRGMAGSSGAYYVPLSEDTLVEGGLDQDQINSVVQSHIGQIVNCYEQGLQSKPSLSGRISVNFNINGSGAVNAARIANTSVDSKKVESCIVAKLRGWKFPRPVGQVNVRVTYPFVLKRLSQG